MATCTDAPCLSPSCEDVRLKADQHKFHNVFYTLKLEVPANDTTAINVVNLLGICATRVVFGYVGEADNIDLRINKQTNSDYPLPNFIFPHFMNNVLVDYLEVINYDDETRNVVIHISTYQVRQRMQQAGMEEV